MKKKTTTDIIWQEFKNGSLKRLGRRKIYLDGLISGHLKDGRPVTSVGGVWKIPYVKSKEDSFEKMILGR